MLSVEVLSRLQFAFTISFHAIFPTLTIGLALFLVYWEYLYLKTEDPLYKQLCLFWTKIFALSFGMGIVSGVVLAYELGANFSGLIAFAGNVLGPLIMLETMTAFFLEAGFLGVMLFGWTRVSKRVHFFATCMVSLGTIISLLWIMSANSFMQTPQGFRIEEGIMLANSWQAVIFNPSFIVRALHMLLSCIVTTSFVIMGISCYYFYCKQDVTYAKASFVPALYTALACSFLQLWVGDLVGLMVYEHQPIKTAAIEANWETKRRAPLVLFAIPDTQNRVNRYEVSIPLLGSLINTHSVDGVLPGLDQVPDKDLPPVKSVFYSFRLMVGIGLWFIILSVWGIICHRKHRIKDCKRFLIASILSTPLGFVAMLSGWLASEMGRQPWVIYHVMRTKAAVSPLPAEQVLISLSVIFVLYMFFFYMYLRFVKVVIFRGPGNVDRDVGFKFLLDALGVKGRD